MAVRPPFHAVYLLRSTHPRYAGALYIGATVDPWRRWRQHNGLLANGAKKTSYRQPCTWRGGWGIALVTL